MTDKQKLDERIFSGPMIDSLLAEVDRLKAENGILRTEKHADAEAIASLEAALSTPNRHAYRVGHAVGKAAAYNEGVKADAEIALEQIEAVEDSYTRWMLANAAGDPDLIHRDSNKLSAALFDMLNGSEEDAPLPIYTALRSLTGEVME